MKLEYLMLPKDMKNASKIDVLKRFLMDNFIIWNSVVFKTNFNFKDLEILINKEDSNELLWIKIWLKVIAVSSENLRLNYAKYCANLMLEKIDENNKFEYLEYIRMLINNIYNLTSFSLFYTTHLMMNFISKRGMPKEVLLLYKNKSKINNIIKENISEDKFSDLKIKNSFNKEMIEYIEKPNYYYMLLDNILALYFNKVNVSKEDLYTCIHMMLKNNLPIEFKKNVTNKLFNEINLIINKK